MNLCLAALVFDKLQSRTCYYSSGLKSSLSALLFCQQYLAYNSYHDIVPVRQ